jgi:hypothetical protein
MTLEQIEAQMEGYLNDKKEALIEEVLWDFQEKITPRLKARMMNTPILELRGKLEKLRDYYLNEYAKS